MNPEESKTTAAPPGEGKKETETKSKSRPVTVDLAVLFAVVFLLLLLAFFMQQRSQQALEDLNESFTSDVAELQLEKQQLELKLEEAQEDLDQAREEKAILEKQVQAMEGLRQMEATARKSYSELKVLVDQFEESELVGYLPTKPLTEGQPSPAEAYRHLYTMIY